MARYRRKIRILVALVLAAIYIPNLLKSLANHTHRQRNSDVEKSVSSVLRYHSTGSSERALCIEENICKYHPNDLLYVYKRKEDFSQLADMRSKNQINITHPDFVVPNLVHFVMQKSSNRIVNRFEFHHMLSVLSAYKIQKPDRIFFWLDQEPTSKYWIQLKEMVPMYLIFRDRRGSFRSKAITDVRHISDIMRLEIVMEFGGIYLDMDVLVVKSFDPLRRYDATMGQEGKRQLCNAVIIAKPWADFLLLWYKEFRNLIHIAFRSSFYSGTLSYYLSQTASSLIHIEEMSFFRPGLYELDRIFGDGKLSKWRNNYCVHLWIRFYRGEIRTDSEIDNWNTTAGEIYRYILYDDWRLRQQS